MQVSLNAHLLVCNFAADFTLTSVMTRHSRYEYVHMWHIWSTVVKQQAVPSIPRPLSLSTKKQSRLIMYAFSIVQVNVYEIGCSQTLHDEPSRPTRDLGGHREGQVSLFGRMHFSGLHAGIAHYLLIRLAPCFVLVLYAITHCMLYICSHSYFHISMLWHLLLFHNDVQNVQVDACFTLINSSQASCWCQLVLCYLGLLLGYLSRGNYPGSKILNWDA